MQTFAVFTAAAVLGAKRSVVSVVIYILLGLAGVPVFTGFRSGVAVIMGPTGGYLVGFVFAAVIIGVTAKVFAQKKWALPVSMVAGQLACYICGTLWYEFVYLNNSVRFVEALMVCVVPFIVPDIIKTTAAIILSKSAAKILKY